MIRLIVLLAALLLPSVTASAQFTIGTVVFQGAPAQQLSALQQTVGLRPGQPASNADLQAAAQRLSDTGAFDDVQVAFSGTTNALKVTFTLKPLPPSARLLVSFQNFFWFTPEELQAGLHERVPLFGATLPESGNLIDAVQAALEAMLHQRSITAKVQHDTAEPADTRQEGRVINFYVSDPGLIVQTIHLSGVEPQFAKDVAFWAKRVAGFPLNQGLVYRTTETRLLIPYVNAGYLTAHIAAPRWTAITSTPDRITLDLAGTVVPGPLLRVGTVAWAGSPEISAEAFTSGSALKPGDPVSLINIEKTTDLLADPYRKLGYAEAVVHNGQTIDEAHSTVNYTFTVEPGVQYRIRSIKPLGLTPQQQTAFAQSFRMKAGDPFDPGYLERFFGKQSPLELFQHSNASYRAERDPATQLADVTITVTPVSSPDEN